VRIKTSLNALALLGLSLGVSSLDARPRALSYGDPSHELRLSQDRQRSLALLHDQGEQLTELASLAGGCRLRLIWQSEGPLQLSELSPISAPRALKEAAREAQLSLDGRGAGRVTITHGGPLTLQAAYSAGCALPSLPQHKTKPKPKSAQSGAAPPAWRALSIKAEPSGQVTIGDEGFFATLSPVRSRVLKVNSRAQGLSWEAEQVSLKLSFLSAHSPLSPLPDEYLKLAAPSAGRGERAASPLCALPQAQRSHPLPCEQLKTLLAFLSYQEGIYEGLGAGVTRRGAQALLPAALLSEHLPSAWSRLALSSALEGGLQWPLSYREALEPLDGRFAVAPLLAQLLERLGDESGEELLRSKRGWRMMGSMLTSHLRGLMRLASHFANRPSRRYLLKVKSRERGGEERHELSTNVTLMPWALSAASRLLKHKRFAPLLGARPGEAKRLERLLKSWRQAEHLFERRVEVYEARRRGEVWSTKVLSPPAGEPWLELLYDVDLLSQELTPLPTRGAAQERAPSPLLSAESFLDALIGSPHEERLKQLLFLGRPYPIGLMSPMGLSRDNTLFLRSAERPYQPRDTRHPLWADALFQRALTQQRQRFWPHQTLTRLEALQATHWDLLKGRSALELEVQRSSPSAQEAPVRPEGRLKRRSWQLLSCLALTLSEPPSPTPQRSINPSELDP